MKHQTANAVRADHWADLAIALALLMNLSLIGFAGLILPVSAWAGPTKSSAAAKAEKLNLDLDDEDEGASGDARAANASTAGSQQALGATSAETTARDSEMISPELAKKLDSANALELKHDYQGMIELLKAVTDKLPRRGLLMLARAYNGNNQPALQVQTLELCLAKNPQDFVVKTFLGEAQIGAKHVEEAVRILREVKASNKHYKPAYEALVKSLIAVGDRFEARSVLVETMKTFTPLPTEYSQLCELYSLDDFLQKSVETCRTATEKDASHYQNYIHLAESLRDLEQSDEAYAILRKAVARFPKNDAVLVATGDLRAKQNDFGVAYDFYKKAVAANRGSAAAHGGLANSALELQKNKEALNEFLSACKIDRKYARDLRIAIAKLKTRKDSETARQFEDAANDCRPHM
jgi:tetratricopeptide (TPR) repeat protein